MDLLGLLSRNPSPRQSAKALARFLAAQRQPFETASVREALTGLLDFYASQDISGLAKDPDADMLLFQYGCYDWGDGEHFQIGLTRQFVGAGEHGEITQLIINFQFAPDGELRALGDDHDWCHSRDELAGFRERVLGHVALAAAERREPFQRWLGWDRT